MTIKILHKQGVSQRKIAKQLGLSWNTVNKYLTQETDEVLYKTRPSTPTKLDPYKRYIQERMASTALVHLSAVVFLRERQAAGDSRED